MVIQIFHLVATFAAVFFLCLVIVAILQSAYARYEEEYLAQKTSDLSEMFLFVGTQQLIILSIATIAIGVALGLVLMGPIVAVVMGIAGFLTPTVLARYYRHRRVRQFERQLVDALVGMSSALRAGMTLHQAMEEIAKSAQAPLSQEFGLTNREIRLGTSTEDALESLANRVASDDLALVVTAINTAKSMGGNMAEMFDELATTIRERFRIEGRIRALTAQGKLQGIIVGLMPFVVWLAFDWVRPDLTRPMMAHRFGYFIIIFVLVWEGIGAFFIRNIIRIRI